MSTSDDWVVLKSSSNAILIDISQGRLDSEGIPAIIRNKQDSSYGFGVVELLVRRSDFLKAKNLLDAE